MGLKLKRDACRTNDDLELITMNQKPEKEEGGETPSEEKEPTTHNTQEKGKTTTSRIPPAQNHSVSFSLFISVALISSSISPSSSTSTSQPRYQRP